MIGGALALLLSLALIVINLTHWEWGRGLFSHLCHQKIDRCLIVSGTSMAICSRCFGIYLGIGVGCLAFIPQCVIGRISGFWGWVFLTGAGVVNGGDFLMEYFGYYSNALYARGVLGLFLGAAIAFFILSRVKISTPKENKE